MTDTARHAALALSRALAATGAAGLAAAPNPPAPRLARGLRRWLRRGALAPLARRLAGSPEPARRALGDMLATAVAAGDDETALALVSTAARRPDTRAEKILSPRYRFLWLAVPKAASRSLIAALRRADPGAKLIRNLSLDELLRAHPRTGDCFTFAFLRHPCTRLLSFHADKHVRGRANPDDRRWFVDPWHGLVPGMDFGALCRWLATPCGSDAFADRHWLSQSRHVLRADGRPPDYLGRYETLQADWRALAERLRLPEVPLPRLNAGDYADMPPVRLDDGLLDLIHRRYAADYTLGGYGTDPPDWPWPMRAGEPR